jgi:hypothetical protein
MYEVKSDNEKIISVFRNLKTYMQLEGYSAGNLITFAKGGPGTNFLGSGWANPEDWGVWNDGSEAHLFIPIKKEIKIQKIIFSVQPYVPKLGFTQVFEICALDQKCRSIKMDKPQQFELALPPKIEQTASTLVITFKFKTHYKVSDFEESSDQRNLAIGLKSISIY